MHGAYTKEREKDKMTARKRESENLLLLFLAENRILKSFSGDSAIRIVNIFV
jgi:hypothetical protein